MERGQLHRIYVSAIIITTTLVGYVQFVAWEMPRGQHHVGTVKEINIGVRNNGTHTTDIDRGDYCGYDGSGRSRPLDI